MNYYACVVLMVAAILPHISCFSTWVPDICCKNLTPIHKDFKPQLTPAPYNISCRTAFVEPGDPIHCTIKAFGDYVIKGFMLQYMVYYEAAGSFPDDPDVYKGMQCSGTEVNDTVTHFSPEPRTEFKVTYYPPEKYRGKLKMHATLMHNFSVFWVDVVSNMVTVLP